MVEFTSQEKQLRTLQRRAQRLKEEVERWKLGALKNSVAALMILKDYGSPVPGMALQGYFKMLEGMSCNTLENMGVDITSGPGEGIDL